MNNKHELEYESHIKNMVFLVGTIRSGTTLFANFLDSNRQVSYCPFELKDIWSKAGVPMASVKTKDRTCPELTGEDVMPYQKEILLNAFSQRMQNKNNKSKQAVFLNKNPHLSNKLFFVHKLFPQAKYIWIIRDLPRVAASVKKLFVGVNKNYNTKHYWPEKDNFSTIRCWNGFYENETIPPWIDNARVFPGGDIRYIAEYWLESNLAINQFFKFIPLNQQFKVNQEELISSTEMVLAKTLNFLNVPVDIVDMDNHHVDVERNNQWSNILDQFEKNKLKEFINSVTDVNTLYDLNLTGSLDALG